MADSENDIKGVSLWADAWVRLKKNKMATVSLFFLIGIMVACFVIPIIGNSFAPDDAAERATSYWYKDPNKINLDRTFEPSSGDHWLGTDQTGRDMFARLLEGGQISILVGLVATLISVAIGLVYGSIAGYSGKRLDAFMMRIVDVLYGLPFLVLVILFSILVGAYVDKLSEFLIIKWEWNDEVVSKYTNLIPLFIAISALGWLTMARIVRAQVQSVKQLEFVEAARSLGLSRNRILIKHIIPNIIGPVIVYATLTVPGFILTEATLSYLGIGVKPPNSSWGSLLKDGSNYLETATRLLIIPSIIFSLTLLALNFLGDGLRDALDPKASKD